MSNEGTAIEKVVEKVSGAMEKLVDMRMLVLGLSLLLYLDIWLVGAGVDPETLTLEHAMLGLRALSLKTFALFVMSYSLLMAAAFPVFRLIYSSVWPLIGKGVQFSEKRSAEAKRLSDWAFGMISFAIWNGVIGYFGGHQSYRGLVVYICSFLSADGFTVTLFRVISAFFILFCVAIALERDV